MARAAAGKKTMGAKSQHAVRSATKPGPAPKISAGGKRSSLKKSKSTADGKKTAKAGKRALGRAKRASHLSAHSPGTGSQNRAEATGQILVPEKAPRLLAETKTTSAALGILEKGIKLIYQKDFKRARQELHSLIESYPKETEILARARTYLQICDREEVARKRPVITNDQIYALGVMEHNRGNFAGAIAHFRQLLEKQPVGDHVHYSLAASFAREGNAVEAINSLRQAISINEDNRIYAKNDSDFESLHTIKEFVDLVGLVEHSPGLPQS